MGNIYGGHYTSYVKNANNNWYLFNDDKISEIKENNISINNAYTIFYRLK